MNAYRFNYQYVRYGEQLQANCISFGETVTEAESKVLDEASRAGPDVVGFEVLSVRIIDQNRVLWNL